MVVVMADDGNLFGVFETRELAESALMEQILPGSYQWSLERNMVYSHDLDRSFSFCENIEINETWVRYR